MTKAPFTRTMEGFCIVATVGALLVIFNTAWPSPPRPEARLHRAIGAALARQTLSLAGSGGKIVVITRDTEVFRQPALDLLLDGFQREIRRASAKVAAIQRLQLDALRPVEVPPGDFYDWIRRAQAGEVIVSLLGPPLLSEAQWRQLTPVKPKIVAFCPGNTARSVDLGRLFDAGFLHGAVVSRPAPATNKGAPAESFEDLYLEVTAANHSRLSSLSSSNP